MLHCLHCLPLSAQYLPAPENSPSHPPQHNYYTHLLLHCCPITFSAAALFPLLLFFPHICTLLPFPHCTCTLCLSSALHCHYLLIPGCAFAANRHSITMLHWLTTSQQPQPPFSGLPPNTLHSMPTFAHCPLLPPTTAHTVPHLHSAQQASAYFHICYLCASARFANAAFCSALALIAASAYTPAVLPHKPPASLLSAFIPATFRQYHLMCTLPLSMHLPGRPGPQLSHPHFPLHLSQSKSSCFARAVSLLKAGSLAYRFQHYYTSLLRRYIVIFALANSIAMVRIMVTYKPMHSLLFLRFCPLL